MTPRQTLTAAWVAWKTAEAAYDKSFVGTAQRTRLSAKANDALDCLIATAKATAPEGELRRTSVIAWTEAFLSTPETEANEEAA